MFVGQRGLAIHRFRSPRCNPTGQVGRVQPSRQGQQARNTERPFNKVEEFFIVLRWVFYIIERTTLVISYVMFALYYLSNCTVIKFHPIITLFAMTDFDQIVIIPYNQASFWVYRFGIWAKKFIVDMRNF